MKTLLVLLSICITLISNAQTAQPYSLSNKTEAIIGSSLILGASSFLIFNSKVTPFTPTEIANLQANNVNSFDRNTTKNYSENIAHTSDIAVASAFFVSVGIQGLVALYSTNTNTDFWKHGGTLAAICIETNLINLVGTNIIKSSVTRTRPYVYNPDVPLSEKTTIHARKSFFSSHTSVTATNCFLAAHVVSQYYPHSWMSYSTWVFAASVPAVIGYMRTEAGKHFPTDVMAGYAFGALCGIIIPQLHKSNSGDQASVEASPLGLSLKYSF